MVGANSLAWNVDNSVDRPDAIIACRIFRREAGFVQPACWSRVSMVPSAERYAAEKQVKPLGVFSDSGHADAQIEGISPDYFQLASLRLAQGRALNADDDGNLAAALDPIAAIRDE